MICTPQCIVTMSSHLHGDIIRDPVMTFYSIGCFVKEISEFVRFHETWSNATGGDKNVLANGINHVFRRAFTVSKFRPDEFDIDPSITPVTYGSLVQNAGL